MTVFSSQQDLVQKLAYYGLSEDALPRELGGTYTPGTTVSRAAPLVGGLSPSLSATLPIEKGTTVCTVSRRKKKYL